MKKLLALAVLVLLSGASNAQNAILIGQSAPLSGANKELGVDIRDGALAYFRKVNEAGGVNGRKIELETLDDGNFGPALPHVEKHKVPFLSPFTGADPMRVHNRYVYNIRASYADELEKIVEHFVPLSVKRFAIVYYDDVVGRENFTAVERALRKRNLAPVSTGVFKDRAKPDIEAGMKAVLKGDPEVVIFTTLYKATADSIKVARKMGSNAFMASNSFPGANQLAKELGKDGFCVIVAVTVLPYARMSLPVVNEYRAAMEKYVARKDYSFTSIEAFLAAKITVEALRRAGAKLTRESFMQALDAMNGYDAGGYTVGFSPRDHNGGAFVELTIIGKDGGFKF